MSRLPNSVDLLGQFDGSVPSGQSVLRAVNCFVVQTEAVEDIHVLGARPSLCVTFVARGNAEGVNNRVNCYHLKLGHLSKQHLM